MVMVGGDWVVIMVVMVVLKKMINLCPVHTLQPTWANLGQPAPTCAVVYHDPAM